MLPPTLSDAWALLCWKHVLAQQLSNCAFRNPVQANPPKSRCKCSYQILCCNPPLYTCHTVALPWAMQMRPNPRPCHRQTTSVGAL